MSGEAINNLVDRLVGIKDLNQQAFEEILSTKLVETEQNPYWIFYDFKLSEGPFEQGEVRLAKEWEGALVSLWPAEGSSLLENQIDLSQWGEEIAIDVNPRIPPEGTDAFIYEVEGVQVSFQFTHDSRRLRSVALKWGEEVE